MNLNKITILADHITEHIQSGDSFSDFISLHYGSQLNKHKNEHNEHKKLPFKHQHLENQFQYVYTLFKTDLFIHDTNISLKENKFAYKEPTSNSVVNRFFQPPQK